MQSLFAPGEGQGAAQHSAGGSAGKSFLYWGLGYRLYLQGAGSEASQGQWGEDEGYTAGGMRRAGAAPVVAPAFGHTGVGGSVGLYDASSDTSIAVTVNKLDFGMKPTKRLLEMLAFELRLPHLRMH